MKWILALIASLLVDLGARFYLAIKFNILLLSKVNSFWSSVGFDFLAFIAVLLIIVIVRLTNHQSDLTGWNIHWNRGLSFTLAIVILAFLIAPVFVSQRDQVPIVASYLFGMIFISEAARSALSMILAFVISIKS